MKEFINSAFFMNATIILSFLTIALFAHYLGNDGVSMLSCTIAIVFAMILPACSLKN
jgi:hypothetical protein